MISKLLRKTLLLIKMLVQAPFKIVIGCAIVTFCCCAEIVEDVFE